MKKRIISFLMMGLAGVVFSGEAVRYQVDGAAFEGFVEKGKAGAPMVLLVHDWDGLTDYEVRRAAMLADLGYSVFCADLFGAGVRPTAVADRRKCTTMLSEDRPKMRRLMQGALDAAKAQGLDTDNAVAMGYCFGGTAVLELARSGSNLKGFATFHGGLGLPDGQDYQKTKGELLIMHGTADSHIGMDQFAALADDLEKAGVGHVMISYGGAPHGWTVFGGGAYREKQDRQSWRDFTEFLRDVLGE
ncbi:dienelactone hydrolase family protein [Pontiella sp.]|uniref:dienelactone hydrolase family protein n=1 Tax=Pontiella sp. TaxID=2837462 RepID=UPI003563D414